MNKRKDYLTNPWTIISLIVFIFWVGWIYVNFSMRLSSIEEWKDKIDIVELQTTLKSIEIDVARIKKEIDKR